MTSPPTSRLDWSAVQFFVAVAETGSIAGAARRLRVNHSTVLRRVAQLEDHLGCRLFDRLPGGYVLTASGNSLAQHLAGVSDQVESVHRQLTGLDPSLEGTLRVTSSDVVVEGLLMPLLAEFRRRHPGVTLQLVTSYGFAALTRREADVAVRGADRAPHDLVAQRVGHIETVLCASKRYLARVGTDTPLAEHRWITLDESIAFPMLDAWIRKHVSRERIVLRVDSLVGAADAVAAGLGIGMLPRPLVAARRDLVQLGQPEPGLEKPIWVLVHPQMQRNARAQALFRFLCESLST
ncbi:MAG: LysR family transcriptional regulator, partial [Kofleriaceae bacterium]